MTKVRRAMIAVASVGLTALLVMAVWRPSGDSAGRADHDRMGGEVYVCPMHPSVRSDRPGACPVCGMALVRRSEAERESTVDLDAMKAVSLSPTQRVLANVATAAVERRTLVREIGAVGVIAIAEPRQATVAARFRGRIERLYVSSTGALVQAGEPLFELYSPDLISAKREFLLAQESAGRAAPAGSVPEGSEPGIAAAARERLRMHFGMTEAQIRQLEEEKSFRPTLTFTSPMAGTVIEKPVQEGQYVDEGMELYRLADLSQVWALLEVYEQDMRFVKAGQSVSVRAEAYPGSDFTGRVTFIEPVLNADTRTVRVRVALPNPGRRLRPNMYVRALISTPSITCLAVPASAVITDGNRSVVWIEAGENRFVPRDVVTGVRSAEWIEVLEGIDEGTLVAVTGGFLLDSESRLRNPSGDPPQDRGDSASPDVGGMSNEETPRAAMDRNVQVVRIAVKGGYTPSTVRVRAGVPVRVEFTREEDAYCTSEIVIPTMGIRRPLAAYATTAVEFTPTRPGALGFECGMGMLHGTLIVER